MKALLLIICRAWLQLLQLPKRFLAWLQLLQLPKRFLAFLQSKKQLFSQKNIRLALPLFWKHRERMAASLLVLLILLISLASLYSEVRPAEASQPRSQRLQANIGGEIPTPESTVPDMSSTQLPTETATSTPDSTTTDPSTSSTDGNTSTPSDTTYPTSTDYPGTTDASPTDTQAVNPPVSQETPTATPTPTPAPTKSPTPTDTLTVTPTETATPTPIPLIGTPVLTKLEQATDQAFGQNNMYVPDSWGVQKNRIVRTSNGDIFTVYIDAGQNVRNRQWHLLHRTASGTWEDLQQGNAGTEPINILRGPNDELHLFSWPGTSGKLVHLSSTDLGKTFKSENVAGSWVTDQGYSGSSIDTKGNMVVFQTADDKPGSFLWSFYCVTTHQWTFHKSVFDYRYTYAFFFPGPHNDLTIVGMRDIKRSELNLPSATGFDYVFNAIKYFYIKDVAHPVLQELKVAEVQPQHNDDIDVTYLTDSYVDSYNRVHILYNNLYDGPHHVVIAGGKIIKDVKQDITYGQKARITQDTRGHFYLITMSEDGKTLNIYPGSDTDTDGTQLAPVVKLDISSLPGCSDDDFCHSPTFTVPRGGNPLSDTIDGVYGNYNQEIYFQINLHGTVDTKNP